MCLDCGCDTRPGENRDTRESHALSPADVRRVADASGLTIDTILALVARTGDRYFVDYPVEYARPELDSPESLPGKEWERRIGPR
jgi:hypothetical protein